MEQHEDQFEEKLPFIQKLAYGVAYIGNGSLSQIALGGAVTFFYNIKMGLSIEFTGLAWLIFAFWNAINDPLIGIIQDRTKSRWGRRIPYLRFGAPFYALSFVLMWFPFFTSTQTGLLISFTLNLFVFDTLYSMIGVITYGLAAEMAITAKARSNLLMVGGFISAIGSIIAMVLPMVLLTGNNSAALNPAFRPTMVGLAIFAMGCLIWSSYYIKENKYTQQEEALSFFKSISESFKNKPFLIFEGGNFFLTIANTVVFTGLYYYIDYVLEIPIQLGGFETSLPLLFIYIFTFLFTLVWNKMNQRFGLKKVFITGLLVTVIAGVLVFFVGRSFYPAMGALVLFGVGFGAISLNTGALNAEVIDYDELRTGKRRETSYSGMNALITKPSISLANWMFLQIIYLFRFPENLSSIPNYVATTSAKTGIMVGFALVPAIAMLIAVMFIVFFPLDGPEWNKKKENIREIHRKKEEEYLKILKESENTQKE